MSLIWILVICALATGVAALVCVRAMTTAERRARRNLYATLGFNPDLIAVLMTQKGSIATQLARLRQGSSGGAVRPEDHGLNLPAARVEAQESYRFTRSPQEDGHGGGKGPAMARARRRPPGANGRNPS